MQDWKTEQRNAETAFDAFYKNPSPLTAVRLAIEDHKAGDVVDWDFVTALNRAADILEAL